MNGTILAVDPGKFNRVLCRYDPAVRRGFWSVAPPRVGPRPTNFWRSLARPGTIAT
jgi:hypothetical protein